MKIVATIQVLDQDTINQIAAGEVVERPASVVKELVENAIDANSTAVTVEIKGGGLDFIRITDNGQGIDKEQIRTAFLRHATSKIQCADDLITVESLGFRGEALSSIAAVAKVELITKTDLGISGVRYVIEGGTEMAFEEIGCPEGTTFVVRNLFYNTPARRKFMKSSMTEAGYVESFMQRLALSHPNISFKFISDNKNKISTSGNGRLKDVIYQIFGRDIAGNLLEIDTETDGIAIAGYIGKPAISRGNRNYENYFVNGRYLKNNIIARAIEEGYKGHAMVHKFPFTVLMIQMNPESFDANVHPAKMEMRFHNGELLYTTLQKAVSGAFIKKDIVPKVTVGSQPAPARPVLPEARKIPEPFEKKRKEIEERFANLTPAAKQKIEARKQQDKTEESVSSSTNIAEKLARLNLSETKSMKEEMKQVILPKKEEERPAISRSVREEAVPGMVKESSSYDGKQMSFADDPLLAKAAKAKHKIIGQVFKTYWMIEYEEKLFFVDQHAAHEKVMYETFLNKIKSHSVDAQMVAPPIILNLSMKEQERYLKFQDQFAKIGYQIEPFGEDAYCIRAVPSNLTGVNQQDLFVEILDQIDDTSSRLNLDTVTDRIATMACKAAVKGNQSMTYAEMDALMDQLMELEHPYQCPHGRPTMISMTKYELDKKFKRIQ